MDEFYLPEEIVEWLGLKKSEYLSRLIQNQDPTDFQFHEFPQFEDFIPMTLSAPDWSSERQEDGHTVKTFFRTYAEKGGFQQVVIGAVIPDQNKEVVFVPIISFVTRDEQLARSFSAQDKINKPTLN